MFARFELDHAVIDQLRQLVQEHGKVLHWFDIAVTTGEGEVVARIRKQVYLRAKHRTHTANS